MDKNNDFKLFIVFLKKGKVGRGYKGKGGGAYVALNFINMECF